MAAKGSLNASTIEFFAYYDRLIEQYGDPLEVLFDLAGDPLCPEQVRVQAAKEAVSYRHSKRKSVIVQDVREDKIRIDSDDEGLH
jgi:hypothetical protein